MCHLIKAILYLNFSLHILIHCLKKINCMDGVSLFLTSFLSFPMAQANPASEYLYILLCKTQTYKDMYMRVCSPIQCLVSLEDAKKNSGIGGKGRN